MAGQQVVNIQQQAVAPIIPISGPNSSGSRDCEWVGLGGNGPAITSLTCIRSCDGMHNRQRGRVDGASRPGRSLPPPPDPFVCVAVEPRPRLRSVRIRLRRGLAASALGDFSWAWRRLVRRPGQDGLGSRKGSCGHHHHPQHGTAWSGQHPALMASCPF